jgi:hypothetical protein
MLINFMAIWNILQTFGKYYFLFGTFVLIWYIFPVLVSRTLKNLAALALFIPTHDPEVVWLMLTYFPLGRTNNRRVDCFLQQYEKLEHAKQFGYAVLPGLPDVYFQTKIATWVHFGGSCNGRCWCTLWIFGLLYGHLIYFMAIWYILWSFGIFPPFWYIVPREIWQPCV